MGRVVNHAGRVLLRIADGVLENLIGPARKKILQVIWDTS